MRKIAMIVLFVLLAVVVVAAVCGYILVRRYYPLRYLDLVYEYADEYDLEPALVCSVINVESGFRSGAVSSQGATGLMQITEGTAYWIAEKIGIKGFDYADITDPRLNIEIGCYFLSMLYREYGDMDVALCAYNAGSGNVNEWLHDERYSKDGDTLDEIPFPETREYVRRISDRQRVYAVLLRFFG